MTNKWKLGLFGLFSGIVSALSWNFGNNSLQLIFQEYQKFAEQLIFYSPGIWFGLAVCIFSWTFIARKPANILLGILWIAASVGSFYVATQVTILTITPSILSGIDSSAEQSQLVSKTTAFFLGGLAGGLLMLTAFRIFLASIAWISLPSLTLLAGVLGTTAVISTFGDGGIHAMFIIWQTGMAFALGWVLDKNTTREPTT